MPETEIKASDAAKKKAEELGVDIAEVEGTGADGAIKVEDVQKTFDDVEAARRAEEAATKEREEAKSSEPHFRVKIGPANADSAFVDRLYKAGEALPESDFERLARAKDTAGRQLILKGKEVK